MYVCVCVCVCVCVVPLLVWTINLPSVLPSLKILLRRLKLTPPTAALAQRSMTFSALHYRVPREGGNERRTADDDK